MIFNGAGIIAKLLLLMNSPIIKLSFVAVIPTEQSDEESQNRAKMRVAGKRAQDRTCLGYAEREQVRRRQRAKMKEMSRIRST